VYQLRQQLNQVSAERISHELKRMLSHETREHSFRLLIQTGLLPEVLPELYQHEHRDADEAGLQIIRQSLHHLKSDRFEPALALILRSLRQPGSGRNTTEAIESVCRRLKLSNEETDSVRWLVESLSVLNDIRSRPLHVRKPLLAHPHIELLLQMSLAIAATEHHPAANVEFCRNYMSTLHADALCPPPLVDGQDLKNLNVPQGPAFRILLSTIRDEQLDEILTTRTAALERLRELVNARPVG